MSSRMQGAKNILLIRTEGGHPEANLGGSEYNGNMFYPGVVCSYIPPPYIRVLVAYLSEY